MSRSRTARSLARPVFGLYCNSRVSAAPRWRTVPSRAANRRLRRMSGSVPLGHNHQGQYFSEFASRFTIAIQQGVVTGNYFSGEGYLTGAHADAIYVPDTTGPVTITNNFIDETPNAGATGLSNNDIRITDELGNINDVTVTGNYLIGAGFNFEVAAPNAITRSAMFSHKQRHRIRMVWPILSRHRQFSDRDRDQYRRLLQPRHFDQRPRGLCGGWRSNGECCLGTPVGPPPPGPRRRRSWATADVSAHLGRRRRRNKFCRRFRVDNSCSAVRARTFSPISPLAMAAT